MTTIQAPVPSEVELSNTDQRFGLADIQLGDTHAIASAKVAHQFDSDPRCENRRIGLANTRKAFSLEICEYKPEAVTLNNALVVRVVTYFLDDILVRLDVDSTGDLASFDSVKSKLETQWESGKQRPLNATNRVESIWMSGSKNPGTDELSISHLDTASIIEYRIRDTRLANKLPWLFE